MLKLVLSVILDLFTAFFAFGYLLGALTGALTENGFNLQGWAALALLGLVAAYFFIGAKTGGTLWQRILRVRAPR